MDTHRQVRTCTLGLSIQHMWKRGMVRCLYAHARCTEQQGQNLEEEEDLLIKAFMGNGYPCSFICFASAARTPEEGRQEKGGGETTHCPPPFHSISERIRRECKNFNIRAVFKSRPTLCSLLMLTRAPPYGEASKCHLHSAMHLQKGVHQ